MFISNKVKIGPAGSKGRGIFAKSQIEPFEIIELSPYIEVPDFDHDILKLTIINYYWFCLLKKMCAVGLGYTSLYNHSDNCNAKFKINKKTRTIKIIAIAKIAPGEEICINYGYDASKTKLSEYLKRKNKKV